MIEILYPSFLYLGVPLIAALACWRWLYYKEPVYTFSSLRPLKSLAYTSIVPRLVPFLLRLGVLSMLCLALARFRVPDERSKVPVQGVDLMLVLDISGSMTAIDDRSDPRSRLAIAREEAIRFIHKRDNDSIGLVFFSGVAVTRCPLTLDKKMLEEILKQTTPETIPVGGTVLSYALIVAANRLKKSTAASRSMIVLTDGAPTKGIDSDPQVSINLAKKLDIKIYTVGIGSPDGGWIYDQFYGWHQGLDSYNEALLRRFAQETGGKFFQARNPDDMRAIYETIDALERSEQKMPVYARYFEYFVFFLWCAFIVLIGELIVTTLLWVRL